MRHRGTTTSITTVLTATLVHTAAASTAALRTHPQGGRRAQSELKVRPALNWCTLA